MNPIKKPQGYSLNLLVILFFTISSMSVAQISPAIYTHITEESGTKNIHQLKLTENYLIYTIYENNPAHFSKTMGGFYNTDDQRIKVDLEFNSNYANDSLKTWSAPYSIKNGNLTLELNGTKVFKPEPQRSQDLDGTWLFATRGPDNGQERRGEQSSRKTLKFLKDGTFQWIAYDKDSFRFSGTGGGSYKANDGSYTEQIEFFSRDSSRVGATLEFNYELKETDWHHTGENSKGEPMYEIWAKRQ